MATKEENQLLINEFVTRNASTINNLESAKQKAVLDAIILIQNKFGTINQTTFKNDVEPKPKVAKSIPNKEDKFTFKIGDTFEVVSNKSTWTIIDIVKDFDEYIIKNDDNQTNTSIRRELFEEDVKLKRIVKIFVNQPVTSSSTTTTTTESPVQVTTSVNASQEEEIRDLEEAIDTQKLLLTFADTKEEKEEIKSLLKDLRVQLKKLKK
jgi:hypothetical protein